jgi:hypothetical protein
MLTTLDVALSQVGVAEATGRNDGVPAERYMRGDRLPWCAGFLLWANSQSDDEQVARSLREYYRMRSVQALEDEFKARGWWFAERERVRPGDWIFCRDRGASDAGAGRHVALCESVIGDIVRTVEGNSGNRVTLRSYRLNDTYLVGFGRLPEKRSDS